MDLLYRKATAEDTGLLTAETEASLREALDGFTKDFLKNRM